MIRENTLETTVSPGSGWQLEALSYDRMHVRLGIILQQVLALRPKSLLELGCGVGILRKELSRQLGNTITYYGCDISREAVRVGNDPNVVQHDLNGPEWPFQDKSFDCIVGSGIMEYIEDVPQFLLNATKSLSQRGHLVISYFNMRHIYRRCQVLFRRKPYRHPAWRNAYSLEGLEELLRQAHLRVQSRTPVSFGLFPPPRAIQQRNLPSVSSKTVARLVPEAFVHTMIFRCITDEYSPPSVRST